MFFVLNFFCGLSQSYFFLKKILAWMARLQVPRIYITSLYSLVTINKSNAFAKLKYKLTQFYKFNPAFGRKTAIINYSTIKVLTHIVAVNDTNVVQKPKPYVKKYVFNDKHIDYFKTENDTFFENHKKIKNLYNADYLRITIGQRPANSNVFILTNDSADDTTDSDDDIAYDDADTEEDDAMDTADDAADTIQYEYNYEYNYNTNTNPNSSTNPNSQNS